VFVLNSNRKGAIAEMKIATAATELGIPVLRPMTEHGRYDLAFEIGGRILRVQCKWGALDEAETVIKVALQTSCLTPAGYVRSPYLPGEIDLVAVYCAALERCYLLQGVVACERTSILLRLTPPRNRQRACINLASDFEFAGAVAQLEERRHGMAEARGSSPLSSTPSRTEVGCHEFRNHFGFYLERAAAGETVEISRRGRPYARLVPVPVNEPRAVAGAAAA
jgi:prevent-host-death family protein